MIKTKPGGDPAAVLFDALQAAVARKTDYVVVDTAGRLHTKTSLMANSRRCGAPRSALSPEPRTKLCW